MLWTAKDGSIWLQCANATRLHISVHGIHSSRTMYGLTDRLLARHTIVTVTDALALQASGTTSTASASDIVNGKKYIAK